MGGSLQNNLSEDANIDTGEIQDDLGAEEQVDDQTSSDDDDRYTDVTLDDINRDDLDPQMQAAYDDLLERDANRQAHFTQRTQQAAQVNRDAESWQAVVSNPQLARVINDAVYNIEHGIPLDQQGGGTQEQIEPPDSETDPEGYINHLIETKMRAVLQEFVPGLQSQMNEVSGFVKGNQANLEFDNLAAKYPAAKAIGLQNIQRVQQQYTDASGRPMPMEKAFALMAQDNPGILQVNATAKSNTKGKTQTRVETSRTSVGSSSATVADKPVGVKALQAKIKQLAADGKLGLEHAGGRAIGLMSKLGGQSE